MKNPYRKLYPQSRLIRTEPVTIDDMPSIMVQIEEILDSPKNNMKLPSPTSSSLSGCSISTTTKPLFLKADDALFSQLADIIGELLCEIKTFRSDSGHLVRSLLYFILIKLNRAYASHYLLSSETENNSTAFRFKELLQNQIRKTRNIDHYARQLGISRVMLNKCIQKQFGVTVSEMVNEFIVFEIKSLLCYTSLTANEISYQLEFSQANHLTRFFKAQTGTSLKEFRNAYQNGSSVI
ncbi:MULTISPECIES: helix-turn-helix domain-containing protein [Flavobacterium]|uniref:helix-turn-helix domain-containing protein n=1 Tax=Flavobacterium TaxID=237 RepID=UPI002113FEDD|nr:MULTISPECIES: AraC family transcriptional regulator [Flavobacterium]UUF12395.1 AraC family transcriptional regulator [Flavobacterium panici]